MKNVQEKIPKKYVKVLTDNLIDNVVRIGYEIAKIMIYNKFFRTP